MLNISDGGGGGFVFGDSVSDGSSVRVVDLLYVLRLSLLVKQGTEVVCRAMLSVCLPSSRCVVVVSSVTSLHFLL